jgi:hypothetical protein
VCIARFAAYLKRFGEFGSVAAFYVVATVVRIALLRMGGGCGVGVRPLVALSLAGVRRARRGRYHGVEGFDEVCGGLV